MAGVAIRRTDLTAAELRAAAVRTDDPKVARRILAIAMVLEGHARAAAADVVAARDIGKGFVAAVAPRDRLAPNVYQAWVAVLWAIQLLKRIGGQQETPTNPVLKPATADEVGGRDIGTAVKGGVLTWLAVLPALLFLVTMGSPRSRWRNE